MARRTFTVKALWDPEAKVYYSESDIEGLHIEAETVEKFEEALMELGPELALANHLINAENADVPLKDLVPAIIWQKPEKPVAA